MQKVVEEKQEYELTPKQKKRILEAMGFEGSEQVDEMEAFMDSRPAARSLVLKLAGKAKEMQRMASASVELVAALISSLINARGLNLQATSPQVPILLAAACCLTYEH